MPVNSNTQQLCQLLYQPVPGMMARLWSAQQVEVVNKYPGVRRGQVQLVGVNYKMHFTACTGLTPQDKTTD